MDNNKPVSINEVRNYWGKKNIPQQWYSKKIPFTLAWFNELAYKRYNRYYSYLDHEAEFKYHAGEEILEIGCGIGTDLLEYARHGALVTGSDLGEDQVMLTKLNFQLHNLPFKDIKTENAENLSFVDESFDLVYSFGVLHHTPDTEKAISEVCRVLKPDGTALIMLYARGWKHYIKRCFIHGILQGRWLANKFDWQKVYNEVSEVNGGAPKTGVYTKRQIKKLFYHFPNLEIKKKRMGEFIDYKPYGTIILPMFVKNIFNLFSAESLIGENWFIRAQKTKPAKDDSVWNVIFKHY